MAHSGVIVALYPNPRHLGRLEAVARRLPDGTPADDMHVTICYLGDKDALEPLKIQIMAQLMILAERPPVPVPLTLRVRGLQRMEHDDDGKNALAARIVCPALHTLRAAIVDALKAIGVQPDRTFPVYQPHITLGYVKTYLPTPQVRVPLMSVDVGWLYLCWGDERIVIPMTGGVEVDGVEAKQVSGPMAAMGSGPGGLFSNPALGGGGLVRRREKADSYSPPDAARNNARRGLELRRKWGRGGTAVGVARARDLANGRDLPYATVARMASFNRHRADALDGRKMPDGGPSAAYIAWLMWGGTTGVDWARGITGAATTKPFVSTAQQRWAFATGQPFAKRWADETDFSSLPRKVRRKSLSARRRQLAALGLKASTDEGSGSASGGGRGYGARAGEVISGRLVRGADGKFTSAGAAPSEAGNSRFGMPKLPPPKKPKGGKGGGKGAKPKPSAEERAAQRAAERKAEEAKNLAAAADALMESDAPIGKVGLDALAKFAAGESLDADMAKSLADLGVVTLGADGQPRLSPDGRKLVNAAKRGDIRGAVDAAFAAGEKMGIGRAGERIDATTDQGEGGEASAPSGSINMTGGLRRGAPGRDGAVEGIAGALEPGKEKPKGGGGGGGGGKDDKADPARAAAARAAINRAGPSGAGAGAGGGGRPITGTSQAAQRAAQAAEGQARTNQQARRSEEREAQLAQRRETRDRDRAGRIAEAVERSGMRPQAFLALRRAAEGGSFDAGDVESVVELASYGLLNDRLEVNDQGRRALRALERGDVRSYVAAVQDARDRQERELYRLMSGKAYTLKHGKHDQRTHGRKGRAGRAGQAAYAAARSGGASHADALAASRQATTAERDKIRAETAEKRRTSLQTQADRARRAANSGQVTEAQRQRLLAKADRLEARARGERVGPAVRPQAPTRPAVRDVEAARAEGRRLENEYKAINREIGRARAAGNLTPAREEQLSAQRDAAYQKWRDHRTSMTLLSDKPIEGLPMDEARAELRRANEDVRSSQAAASQAGKYLYSSTGRADQAGLSNYEEARARRLNLQDHVARLERDQGVVPPLGGQRVKDMEAWRQRARDLDGEIAAARAAQSRARNEADRAKYVRDEEEAIARQAAYRRYANDLDRRLLPEERGQAAPTPSTVQRLEGALAGQAAARQVSAAADATPVAPAAAKPARKPRQTAAEKRAAAEQQRAALEQQRASTSGQTEMLFTDRGGRMELTRYYPEGAPFDTRQAWEDGGRRPPLSGDQLAARLGGKYFPDTDEVVFTGSAASELMNSNRLQNLAFRHDRDIQARVYENYTRVSRSENRVQRDPRIVMMPRGRGSEAPEGWRPASYYEARERAAAQRKQRAANQRKYNELERRIAATEERLRNTSDARDRAYIRETLDRQRAEAQELYRKITATGATTKTARPGTLGAVLVALKHGKHDQSSHGRRGPRGRSARSAYQAARAGGASHKEALAAANDVSRSVQVRQRLANIDKQLGGQVSARQRTSLEAEARRLQAEQDRLTARMSPEARAAAAGAEVAPTVRGRTAPAKPQPARTDGDTTRAYGADPNTSYQLQHRLVDMDDIRASNLPNGAINPDYDPRLQPRDRSRAASQAQIDNVARNLNSDVLVTDFHRIDAGSPIIDADGNVLSGNGRTLALQRARELNPEQYAAYRARLREEAARLGIDPAAVDQMRNPVLVRELRGDADPVAFAREANSSGTLRMSPLEQAMVDANQISDRSLLKLNVREGQGIDQALRDPANKSFINDFLATVPDNERANLLTRNGDLNQMGLYRAKAALYTRAFPGEAGQRLAESMLESLDPDVKTIQNGISAGLPNISRATALIRSGDRDRDLDLTEDFARTIDVYARIKDNPALTANTPANQLVSKYLSQSQMFDRELTPDQEKLLRHIDSISRKPTAVAAMFNRWASIVEDQPPPGQVSLFGGGRMSKSELIDFLIGGGSTGPTQGGLFDG